MIEGPRFDLILETALYYEYDQRSAMHGFYEGVLGLRRVAGWETGTAYRVGSGVLLIFARDRLADKASPVAAHGATGPGHICLRAEDGAYLALRSRLESAGVEIRHDHEWPDGRSFYFADPAGNLLEVADRDIWPQ